MVIGKLRSDTGTDGNQQHWKAAKALLVIIPLLGIPYLITMVPPTDKQWYLWFQIVRALLLSLQGSIITVPYCFLNTEVRATISNSSHRWKLSRNINGGTDSRGTRSTRDSISMAGHYSINPG